VLKLARQEALCLGDGLIGPEHILLGLMRKGKASSPRRC